MSGHPGHAPGSPIVMQAPVIETERLRLRSWQKADFRPYHEIMKHPDVHRHFGPEPIGAEECWRRMLAAVGGWQFNGFGTWAVERISDGKLIGNAGLFTAWRALEPEFGEQPEMGWIFSSEVHGQGFAGEACRAVLQWAEANLAPTPIWAIIAPENIPSLKLAERLGFTKTADTEYHGDPTVVLQRPAWA
ncbi:GNAT family N-acetyltransferase [Sphingomonas edaphi]|uniref:N-acetyltransferase n=1 Tax=Sphingomonas edaphi TaxID=2315689 RepID=A0A418Q1B1_9SPHN|nr:GNAT family N-acetyltransferase [Sphingomonas edaphi]RIX31631.1 N-acetyltransferase [Sphingomonas edaphi]